MNEFRFKSLVIPRLAAPLLFALVFCVLCPLFCLAQDLEPRRWSHVPIDTNFLGVGYGYSEEDIFFDPTLGLEDTESNIDTVALKYIRTFECLGKTTRFEVLTAFQEAHWRGLLNGAPATANRSGLADPVLRIAANLLGAPPLAREEFARYRAATDKETIVGAALSIQLPFGEYYDDKLLNLGGNRFVFRPELGVIREWKDWSVEITSAASFYTDNDDFFGESKRQQAPFVGVATQVVYNFYPAIWAGIGGGYGIGGESTINGVDKNDERENIAWAATIGFPLAKQIGAKIGYIGSQAQESIGSDTGSILLTVVTNW